VFALWLLPALALLWAVSAWLAHRRRQQQLAALRVSWGRPRTRARAFDAIAEYHRSRIAGSHVGVGGVTASPSDSISASDRPDAPASLDDRTWSDLNLDAVFATIDRTESTLGQQALYHRLRSAPVADHLDAFDALVERMRTDAAAREQAQLTLARLQDPAGYDLWWLAQGEALGTRPWHALFPALALGMLASLVAIPLWPGALLLAIVLIVINLLVRIATARRVGALLGSFRQIGPLLATGEALAFLDAPDVQAITGALRTELPALRSLRAVARWAGRDPLAADPLTAMLLEYLNLLFLVDLNALYFGTRELQARGGALRRVIAATGDIDSAIAVASFRAGARHWTRPRFRNSTATPATNATAATATIAATSASATLTDICHPLIDAAVPNSIALGPPHGVLVTGSNMSGKTTFLRTVGVTTILAQTINTCLATEYDAPVFSVRSCIGRTDDLVAGKSYYLVEVEAVLALVRASASGTPHLFLLDELFRGTNAVERVAAAEAVLIELLVPSRHADAHAGATATATASARQLKPHAVLVSTHDDGLVDLVGDLYVPCHFAETVGDEGLVFDHRLRPGPATTHNAIALLRLHGAPDSLVSHALARAAHLDPSYSLDR
jgi:hypothetical protein